MRGRPELEAYLGAVRDQIRWKATHETATRELTTHILDQRDAYIARGVEQEEAMRRAIAEMGDPIATGQQLDGVHRPRPDWAMVGIVAALLVLGVGVQVLLAIYDPYRNPFGRLLSYVRVLPIGIAVLCAVFLFDYSKIARHPMALYLAFLIMNIALGLYAYVFHLMRFPAVTIYTLLIIPLYAGVMYGQRGAGYRGPIVCGVMYALGAYALLWVGGMSELIHVSIACLIMLIVAIARNWYVVRKPIAYAALLAPVILIPAWVLIQYPHIRVRMMSTFFGDSNYQMDCIRSVIAHAKLIGEAKLTGVNALIPLEKVLPQWRVDFMLNYIIGKFGILAGCALVAVPVALLVKLYRVACRQRSELGFMIALCVAITMTLEVALFVATNLGLSWILTTLPLLSFGGTSLVTNMALLGLALSAVRRNGVQRDAAPRGTPGPFARAWAAFWEREQRDMPERYPPNNV